jgi:hypothetical protein
VASTRSSIEVPWNPRAANTRAAVSTTSVRRWA